MALYPITQYDFPNNSLYDSDLREILKLMREVYDQYNNMYQEFNFLDNDFKNYIRPHFDAFEKRMEGLTTEIDSKVTYSVNKSVSDEMVRFDTMFAGLTTEIKYSLEQSKNEIGRYKTELKRLFDMDILKFNEEFKQLTLQLQEDFKNLRYAFEDRFSELEKRSQLYTDIKLNAMQDFVLLQLNKQKFEFEKMLAEFEKNLPPVYNPARGMIDTADNAINDVYNADRYGGASAWTETVFALTAAELDDWKASALEIDTLLGCRLNPPDYCRNPINGNLESMCSIIESFAEIISNDSITVDSFQSLNLTANDLEEWQNQEYYFGNGIPAREWYLHSYGILMYEPNLTPTYVRYMLSELWQRVNKESEESNNEGNAQS